MSAFLTTADLNALYCTTHELNRSRGLEADVDLLRQAALEVFFNCGVDTLQDRRLPRPHPMAACLLAAGTAERSGRDSRCDWYRRVKHLDEWDIDLIWYHWGIGSLPGG